MKISQQQREVLQNALKPSQKALIEELLQRGYSPTLKSVTDPLTDRPQPTSDASSQARSNFLSFVTTMRRGYVVKPFHELICNKLDGVVAGTINRLIITLPPRMGKSLLASIHLTPYYLGHHPDHRVLHTSYSDDLLQGFSRQARDIVWSEDYQAIFPDIRIDENSRSVDRWDLAQPFLGGYAKAGVGGSITGKGANLLLVDDPISGDAEARSELQLDNLWSWYTDTAYTRLEGYGAVIVIMTRWHEYDLVGRLIELQASSEDADSWDVLHFPAIAEDDDILGRKPGEALWPEKMSEDRLRSVRALNTRSFEAIHQGNPSPPEGNIFKKEWWSNRWEKPENYRLIELHYDTAVKKGSRNDWTAMVAGGLTWDGRIHILDLWWQKMEFPELVDRVKSDYQSFVARGLRPTGVLIEDKASGSSLYQTLKEETQLPVDTILPEGDKEARAITVAPYFKAAKVLYPAQHPKLSEYFLLMEKFPHTKIKDPVDATTQCVSHLMKNMLALSGMPKAGGTRPVLVNPSFRELILPHGGRNPSEPMTRTPLHARGDVRIR
jgi:predicted phage terminase large subunit-like protein